MSRVYGDFIDPAGAAVSELFLSAMDRHDFFVSQLCETLVVTDESGGKRGEQLQYLFDI